MNKRRKLIFFTNSDPAVAPERIEMAYHMANVAAGAGVEAEVRLAGDAVKVALPNSIADTTSGREVRKRVAQGLKAPYAISL